MEDKQNRQIEKYLITYSTKSNDSWGDDNMIGLHMYWKGQVMGMCKIIDTMNLDIDTEYYLQNLL